MVASREKQVAARAEEKKALADERRAQIRQATAACMARNGYDRTTMDDIARECGLSKGALYWLSGAMTYVTLCAKTSVTLCQ